MKVGYVLKRFPRASETFIAQEILGLERLGAEVVVFALRANDQAVRHSWLSEIKAPVFTFEPASFSACWRALQDRARCSERWRAASHEALLAAFDHPKRSGKRYLVESWWISEMIESMGVEHLHAHFANHPAFVAMLVNILRGTSFSFTAHAKDIYLDSPTKETWCRQLGRASFAVTVSHSNRRFLDKSLGSVAVSKLRTLYNGVDLERIRPQARKATEKTSKVVFASRLIEKKGADLLVETVARIAGRYPNLEITIIGDGECRRQLEEQAAALGVADRICFAGMLSHQETVSRIAESDLFVLPCRVATNGDRDALPTVLLEAMAAGIPCVSTPVNGVPEIIDQGRTGMIVPENDPDSLAAAIEHLLGDPALRRRMGVAARYKTEQKFDLRSSCARLHELMQSAVGASVLASTAEMAKRAAV